MAKLEVRKVPLVPVVPTEEYILTLTKAEAETILAIVGKITGSDCHSRRGYANRVYHALYTAMGSVSSSDMVVREGNVGIHFRDVEGLDIYPEGK